MMLIMMVILEDYNTFPDFTQVLFFITNYGNSVLLKLQLCQGHARTQLSQSVVEDTQLPHGEGIVDDQAQSERASRGADGHGHKMNIGDR